MIKKVKAESLKGKRVVGADGQPVRVVAAPASKALPKPSPEGRLLAQAEGIGQALEKGLASVAEAVATRSLPEIPDHSKTLSSIDTNLKKLADRPVITRWVFKVSRDQSGDSESIVATGGKPKGS